MAAAGLVIRDGGAEHDRQRRIKAHRLVDEAAEINETRKVLWGRRTGTEHGIEFGMEALLRGRELRQQVPAPGHRAQRRLGACGEGQHLVAQFRCAELPAGLAVARSRHAPQQILAAGISRAAPLREELVEQRVIFAETGAGTAIAIDKIQRARQRQHVEHAVVFGKAAEPQQERVDAAVLAGKDAARRARQ